MPMTSTPSGCRDQLLLVLPVPSDPKLGLRMDTFVTSVAWEQHTAGTLTGLELVLSAREDLEGVLKVTISDKRSLLFPISADGIDSSKLTLPAGGTMRKVLPCKL